MLRFAFPIALFWSFAATSESVMDGFHQICRQPILNGGHCDKPQARWAYDIATGRCQEFVYNGCLGNLNNFLVKSDCEEMCSGVVACRGLEVMPYGCIVTELADGPDGCPDFKIDCSNYPRRFPKHPKSETIATSSATPSVEEETDRPQTD